MYAKRNGWRLRDEAFLWVAWGNLKKWLRRSFFSLKTALAMEACSLWMAETCEARKFLYNQTRIRMLPLPITILIKNVGALVRGRFTEAGFQPHSLWQRPFAMTSRRQEAEEIQEIKH